MSSNLLQNSEYKSWLKNLKQTILQTQIKAAVRVNTTLLQFKSRRMGKGLYPCPSCQRVVVDGHVVPPLPILHGCGDNAVVEGVL